MSTPDVRQVLKREGQLNAIAYVIMVLLLGIILALIVPWVSTMELPQISILSNQIARTLFFGVLLMFILYLIDQHRRLRGELLATHGRLEIANAEISSAYERLSFAQHTASLMTSLTEPNALERVLGDSTGHFGAEAAAVVGDDITLIASPGVDVSDAESAVLQVALEVVRAGKAMATKESSQGGEAIAVPLRINGELKSVVCLWRKGDAFPTDQLEGLILMARIIELSMENRMLLHEVKEQLTGTLSVLSTLIDQRLPDYKRHSMRLAEHAAAIGRSIGLSHKELTDLRIAAQLADVGMLQVPESILAATHELSPQEMEQVRVHPTKGAEVAKSAHFSIHVQEGIHNHHERLDGSGYPRGRKGDAIPVAARILAVCDVYDSMTVPRPTRPRYTPVQAISTLMRGAGTLYDAEIVRAFMQVIGHGVSDVVDRQEPEPARPVSRESDQQPLRMVN